MMMISHGKSILNIIYKPDFAALFIFRLSTFLYQFILFRPFAYLLTRLNDLFHGVWIGPRVQVDGGLALSHSRGLIVNPTTKIGKNCLILQQVTIGGPNVKIGDNVSINAGAKLISNVRGRKKLIIGNNCIIAAGAVVTKDVPNNSIVAGIPAKIIKSIKDDENWINFSSPNN
jgi:serine O-acetyltransferase